MIAFAADLHLRRFMWRSRRDMDGDSFRALESMMYSILGRWVQSGDKELHVILGGDVFDEKRVDGSTLQAFTKFVDTLYEQGVEVYFIQGNHDLDAVEAVASIQGATHIHKEMVVLDGRKVYGLDWQCKSDLPVRLSEVPECDILVLHQMFEHLVHFEAAADLDLDAVPLTAKNVLVGDVHVRDVTPLRGEGVCISPGPLQPCNIEQAGPHGSYILESGKSEWEFVPHNTREIHRTVVQDEADLESLSEVVASAIKGYEDSGSKENLEPILEIKYHAKLVREIEEVLAKNPSGELLKVFMKPTASSVLLSEDRLQQVRMDVEGLSLHSSLDIFCDPKDDENLYDFLSGCLSGNEDREIERILENVL